MKTNLETLIAASTPGELKAVSDERGTYVGRDMNGYSRIPCVAPMNIADDKEALINARRIALSWNRFPEAVELLGAFLVREQHGFLHSKHHWKEVSELLAAIEKESKV